MTYPFAYGPQFQQPTYTIKTKEKSSTPAFIAGATVGGIGGAIAGYKAKPFVTKNGTLKNDFVENVLEKYLKVAEESFKNIHDQNAKILQDIKDVANMKDFNALKQKHSGFFENIKLSTENINESNLAENLNTIKQHTEANINTFKQDFRNKIQVFWNKEKSVFENKTSTNNNIYNTVEKVAKNIRFKNIAKYAGIGAAVTGISAFILHKVLSNKNSLPKQ